MNTSDDNTPHIIEVTAQNVQQAVLDASSKVPVLLDVWAESCEACKVLSPILEKLPAEYAGRFMLAKINADEEQELATQLGVQSLPTIKLIVDGQMGAELSGLQPESVIRNLLDQFVKPDTQSALDLAEKIRAAITARDTDLAQQLLQEALSDHPEDKIYQFLAVELLIAAGELVAAKERFVGMGDVDKGSEEARHVEAGFYFADFLEATGQDVDYYQQLENDPVNADALFYLAATKAMSFHYDEALEFAWRLFESNMSYKSGEPKTVLLRLFDLLGKSDIRAQKYRRKMFNFLH
ncbi:MAG: tetratricopeptide repeat protein [Pseudomonadales bacterium]|nr:tetratricopeptide repeat protein [Pseudomonadales bacterium]